jgi:hypothetical protein
MSRFGENPLPVIQHLLNHANLALLGKCKIPENKEGGYGWNKEVRTPLAAVSHRISKSIVVKSARTQRTLQRSRVIVTIRLAAGKL